MARGRPRKYKGKTLRRTVIAPVDTFELLASLNVSYSDAFNRGVQAYIEDQISVCHPPGNREEIDILQLAIMIREEDAEIECHQRRKETLIMIREKAAALAAELEEINLKEAIVPDHLRSLNIREASDENGEAVPGCPKMD